MTRMKVKVGTEENVGNDTLRVVFENRYTTSAAGMLPGVILFNTDCVTVPNIENPLS